MCNNNFILLICIAIHLIRELRFKVDISTNKSNNKADASLSLAEFTEDEF